LRRKTEAALEKQKQLEIETALKMKQQFCAELEMKQKECRSMFGSGINPFFAQQKLKTEIMKQQQQQQQQQHENYIGLLDLTYDNLLPSHHDIGIIYDDLSFKMDRSYYPFTIRSSVSQSNDSSSSCIITTTNITHYDSVDVIDLTITASSPSSHQMNHVKNKDHSILMYQLNHFIDLKYLYLNYFQTIQKPLVQILYGIKLDCTYEPIVYHADCDNQYVTKELNKISIQKHVHEYLHKV
jgi:hypothetical protein